MAEAAGVTGGRTARLVVGAVLVTAPLLAGCSGADTPAPLPAPTATVAAERTPEALPALSGAKGVQQSVTIASCGLEAGQATASGTLVNTAKPSRDFAITIAWMPANSTSPVQVASTTVKAVAGGSSHDWSVTAQLPTKADRCVINARRGRLT